MLPNAKFAPTANKIGRDRFKFRAGCSDDVFALDVMQVLCGFGLENMLFIAGELFSYVFLYTKVGYLYNELYEIDVWVFVNCLLELLYINREYFPFNSAFYDHFRDHNVNVWLNLFMLPFMPF